VKRRVTVLLVIATVVALSHAIGGAFAAPPNKTSLALSCDRNARAVTVHVTLTDTITGALTAGPFSLSCGPESPAAAKMDRQVQDTGFAVGYTVVDEFNLTTGLESVPCAAAGTVPLKFACTDASGAGATLVVR
jgi:hypothetical protein